MRVLAAIALSYVLFGALSPLLHQLQVARYAPDVASVAVLYLGLELPLLPGLAAAFAIGLLHDAFAMGPPIGMYTEVAVLTFLLVRAMRSRLRVEALVPTMAATAALAALSTGLVFALATIFDQRMDDYGFVLSAMLPNAAVSAPFGALLLPLYRRLGAAVTPRASGGLLGR